MYWTLSRPNSLIKSLRNTSAKLICKEKSSLHLLHGLSEAFELEDNFSYSASHIRWVRAMLYSIWQLPMDFMSFSSWTSQDVLPACWIPIEAWHGGTGVQSLDMSRLTSPVLVSKVLQRLENHKRWSSNPQKECRLTWGKNIICTREYCVKLSICDWQSTSFGFAVTVYKNL